MAYQEPLVRIDSVFEVGNDKLTIKEIRRYDVVAQLESTGGVLTIPHGAIEKAALAARDEI